MRIVSESTAKASPLMSWKIFLKVPRLFRLDDDDDDDIGRDPDEETPEAQHTDLSALLQTLPENDGILYLLNCFRKWKYLSKARQYEASVRCQNWSMVSHISQK